MTIARSRRRLAASAAILAATLALASCASSKSTDPGAAGGGDVKTDIGVTADKITLGVLGDSSGLFKNLGIALIRGNEMWASDVNARGGICGRQIELNILDSQYKADVAKTQYQAQKDKILGYLQLLGSPANTALKTDLQGDKITSLALSWASTILDNPYTIIPGTTYDVEMINAWSYLLDQGGIKAGDKIGHIYIDSEYGQNGFAGTKYFAEQKGLTVVPVPVAGSLNDMANVITGLRGEGVKAIGITTTPTQASSVLTNNAALGLNVPVLGNNPVFDPVQQTPENAAAYSKLLVAASAVPFSSDVPKAKEIAAKYEAAYKEPPNYGAPYGFAGGLIWEQILTKACENKDLTRDGIQKAFKDSKSITTADLVAPLDFSILGAPATRQIYLAQVDSTQKGGLKQIGPLFVSELGKGYKAPKQP